MSRKKKYIHFFLTDFTNISTKLLWKMFNIYFKLLFHHFICLQLHINTPPHTHTHQHTFTNNNPNIGFLPVHHMKPFPTLFLYSYSLHSQPQVKFLQYFSKSRWWLMKYLKRYPQGISTIATVIAMIPNIFLQVIFSSQCLPK